MVVPVEEDLESRIIGWLQEGHDDARDIIDFPWIVNNIAPGKYTAEYPKMPFVLNLIFGEGFVYLIVPLGVDTLALPTDERLKIYHTLLRLNGSLNLLKFTLSGMNDDIMLRVDLDKKTLGRDEFNDALTALLLGINEVVRALGLEEDFAQSVFEHVIGMVIERMEKGATKAELMDFLVAKVGLSKEDAEALLNQIFNSVRGTDEDIGYF
ncbi:DNA-binding protein [Thermococcus sp.]